MALGKQSQFGPAIRRLAVGPGPRAGAGRFAPRCRRARRACAVGKQWRLAKRRRRLSSHRNAVGATPRGCPSATVQRAALSNHPGRHGGPAPTDPAPPRCARPQPKTPSPSLVVTIVTIAGYNDGRGIFVKNLTMLEVSSIAAWEPARRSIRLHQDLVGPVWVGSTMPPQFRPHPARRAGAESFGLQGAGGVLCLGCCASCARRCAALVRAGGRTGRATR